MRVPLSARSHPCVLLSVGLILAIVVEVSHCGFNLHSLMANDAEHLFTCSLAICVSLEKPLFETFKLGCLALLLRFFT